HSSGVAGRDLLCSRLDRRDETFSAVCRKIRSLQPDISRAGIDCRASYLDVFNLPAAVAGGQIKRHSSTGTRKNAESCACYTRACSGKLESHRFQDKQGTTARPLPALSSF